MMEHTSQLGEAIMRRSQLRFAVLIVAGALFVGACNSFKIFETNDDKAITTDIQAKLFNDPILKTRDIHVDSQRGIVTLTGTVGTDLERAAVERIATQENGVKSVVNMLALTSQTAAPASQPVQSAETASQPPPPEAEANPAAPARPRSARHHKAARTQEEAAPESAAFTDANPPEAPDNPAAAPNPPVAAQVAAAPPQAAAPVPAPPPPPAPKPAETINIPGGTVVTIRMIDGVDSSRNQPGEEFAASLDSPIVVGDRVVVARGADARVCLVNAKTAGHISGQSELQLELIGLTINGKSYPTESGYYEQHGASRGTRTAETVGGGAILGALIGGLLGHGRGAAAGAAVGAGAGTGVQVATKGQQVKVPSETKLDFTLKSPITVTMSGG
jgi:hypothetical protein